MRRLIIAGLIVLLVVICGCSSSGSSNPDAVACSAVLSDLSASSPAAGNNLSADAQLTQTNTLYQAITDAANAYTVGSAMGASGTVSQVVDAGGGAPAIAVIQAKCGSS
jgi:hypothetical protein